MIQWLVEPPATDSWNEEWVLIRCVWLSPDVVLCIMTKHLQFGPKDIVPEFGLFRCSSTNQSHAGRFFSEGIGFPLGTLPNLPYLCSSCVLFCFVLFCFALFCFVFCNFPEHYTDFRLNLLLYSWDDQQLSWMFSTCEYSFSLLNAGLQNGL